MKLQLVRPGVDYNALQGSGDPSEKWFSAPVSPIAELKEMIAIGVLELNEHARKGAQMSFLRVREDVNRKVDQYIEMRRLSIVK